MKALQITMQVTPWKAPQSQVQRLEELGAPQFLIDRSRDEEVSRSEKLRAAIAENTTLRWVEWATRFEGEMELRFLSYSGGLPRHVLNSLDDLQRLGVIDGYTSVTL